MSTIDVANLAALLVASALQYTVQQVVDAAVELLIAGRKLAWLCCPNCKALHLDQNSFAVQPYVKHMCNVCKRTWKEAVAV